MLYRPIFLLLLLTHYSLYAQNNANATLAGERFSLTDCIKYAIRNQPALNQAYIDEEITAANNAIAYAAWLPQVSGAANYQHYFQLPTTFSRASGAPLPVQSGATDISIPSVTATQTIFTTDLLLVSKTAKLYKEAAGKNTISKKIDVVTNVSKAFYDLLLSMEQTGVYREDTARLAKNLSDAYNRYKSGVADKVDYKQASISLNNSRARLKNANEQVAARYATLKMMMGFPADKKFEVAFDTAAMMQDVYADTAAQLQFDKRIEYQQLLVAKKIQQQNTLYYRMGFLPSLSAFYNYNYEFESNQFADLYKKAYPYSLFGLQLNIPVFTGFKRNQNIRKAHLQEQRIDWDEINLKLGIYAQYTQALANYKSNLYYLLSQGENTRLAQEVYATVKLQYSEGVKTYLDVIIAEADLQTSEINYLNALFQLLSSKIDLERAMGDIPTDI